MNQLHLCLCTSGGGIEDVLKCAPCPPPFLSYIQLKMTAIGKLCQKEVCSIARRCNMSETPALTKDCPVNVTTSSIECDTFCIIMIASVLSIALLIILIIVVYKRRRGGVKQDAITAMFNDTDSDTSGKSSDRGSTNIVEVHADCHEVNITGKEMPTKCIGGNSPAAERSDQNVNINDISTKNGLRSRSSEKNNTSTIANL